MTMQSGELSGLFTTTCVEKGKFSDVAGLQRINEPVNVSIFPSLLNIAIYRSLKNELSYISKIITDIRNDQIASEQARFERVTEAPNTTSRKAERVSSVDRARLQPAALPRICFMS